MQTFLGFFLHTTLEHPIFFLLFLIAKSKRLRRFSETDSSPRKLTVVGAIVDVSWPPLPLPWFVPLSRKENLHESGYYGTYFQLNAA